jgi:uncharacterized damage-inducible protein DinB
MNNVDPRYPIGKFQPHPLATNAERAPLINAINETARRIREAVHGLSESQLEAQYRDGGWTLRQVVHHLADSHMNAYCRFKLATTETEPTIKPYNESLWAESIDARTAPVETSLTLLTALHERWVIFLNAMKPEDFKKTFRHPEHGVRDLDWLLQLYAWHGRHHEGHITAGRGRSGK